jgi:RND family efflux transporter MFP subunit
MKTIKLNKDFFRKVFLLMRKYLSISKQFLITVYGKYKQLEKNQKRLVQTVLIIIILNFGFRIYSFISAKFRSEASAQRIVAVIAPVVGGAENSISFPGRLEAYLNAPIYSRVNGYMKKWDKDIGAEVKKGEILGKIEAPEVDQQLQQAKSDLIAARSGEALARISLTRWKNLFAEDAVSRQELDQKTTEYETKKSLRQIAEANLQKAEIFSEYKNIPAPFSGMVTERNIDVGALVSAGSGKPLFNIANIDKLRLFVNIPQVFMNDIQPGIPAKIRVPEFPEKIFEAKVIRSAGAVNENSGTVLIEIEMDNQEHILTAGEFAQVNIDLPSDRTIPRVPSSALIIRKNGAFLAEVGKDQKAIFTKIVIGRDFGQEVEVIGPITNESRIINNPPDSLNNGELVVLAKEPNGNKAK